VKESELSVGRGPNVDWVLPDPDQVVSRHHFTIIQRSGGWFIIDESSNGTYANRDRKPIGRGNRRRLSNRDRINVGPYELEVTVEDETFASLPRDPSLRARRPPLRDDRYGSIRDVMLPPMPGGALPAAAVPLLPMPMLPAFASRTSPADTQPVPVALTPIEAAPPVGDAVPVGPTDEILLGAFLEGLGLPEARPLDPPTTFRRLGETFRALVTGLRAVLIARASIKGAFRIEQTMIRARGNNPLKFSANDDDAIALLLGAGRRSGMEPAAVIAQALRDIRRHELATMAAMQAAAQALLTDLHPDRIRNTVERAGGMTLLPAQKKARAWEIYETLHASMQRAMQDDFENAFGKAFARAYEESLGDLESHEPE
jgi:predicted component of type VI protein secretion system